MTDEEIKIKATKIAMKESCDRCDKILCDSPSEYCKWFNGCYKLAKENAELKEQNTKLKERAEKLELLTEQYDKLCWKLDAMLEKLEGKQ